MLELVSQKEAKELLEFTQKLIQGIFKKQQEPSLIAPLREKRLGLFVSLYLHETLRGCVGTPFPTKPLEETLRESTLLAATKDGRFAPLCQSELSELTIEISLLSHPEPIHIDQIQIGIHGLIIQREETAALILPQIASEKGWSVHSFLQEVCIKAGLEKEAWKTGEILLGFEVQLLQKKLFSLCGKIKNM